MSQSFTEQWERRKWYLVQSLFNDVPLLSPIPETQEPQLEPSPTEVTLSRPHSPLPDLIIEKEPNRHDEPEEYYEALERKIKKLYSKMFRDTEQYSPISELQNDDEYFNKTLRHASCSEITLLAEELVPSELSFNDNESDHNNNQSVDSSTNNVEPTISLCDKIGIEDEELLREEKSSETHEKTKQTDSLTEVSTSSKSQNYETIITQALVHRAGSEEIDNHTHNIPIGVMLSTSSEIQNQSENNAVASLSETQIGEVEEQSEQEHLETEFENSSISNDADDVASLLDDEEQPEVMRKRVTSNDPVESINEFNVRRYFSGEFTIDRELEITSVREMEVAEISSPELSNIQNTTTSKLVGNEQEKDNYRSGERKRRILSELSSYQSRLFSKQRKFQNRAIQTSLGTLDSERNWQEIQKDFFEGKPRIFKLCSCVNHVCR